MRQRQAVENPAVLPPLRHVGVHQRHEPIVVASFQQVREFVRDDIFEALHRLLGQLGIEADIAGARATISLPNLDGSAHYLVSVLMPFLLASGCQFQEDFP